MATPLKAADLLPKNPIETHIIVTEGSSVMDALADRLNQVLYERPGERKPILLRAVNASDAAQMALAHSPYSISTYIVLPGRSAQRLQDALSGETQMQVNPVSIVFNPYSVLGDRKTLTDETFLTVAEGFSKTTVALTQNRLAIKGESLDTLVANLEEKFAARVVKWGEPTSTVATKVVKVGGSMADLTVYAAREGGYEIYKAMVKAIADMAIGYNFVFTVGGGPVGDTTRAIDPRMGSQTRVVRANYMQQAENFIEEMRAQMPDIAQYRGTDYNILLIDDPSAALVLPGQKTFADNGLRAPFDIVVIAAPEGLMSAQAIPPERSDLLTVIASNYLGVPNIIFVKDAQGIHYIDPNFSESQAREALPAEFHQYIGNNPSVKRMYAGDIQSGRISRLGVKGGDQHLVEDDALTVLRRHPAIGSIQIVNGRSPEDVKAAIKGEPVGSYVLNDLSPRSG